MNNFGVIEIAGTTTKNTPGWAYVPDTGPALAAGLQPANRKRAARNQPALSLSDLSARQETRIRKDLEALDRDNHRDANIPIPPKAGGSRAQNKHTPNVRKILQSQKTFANHLDDYQAMLALAESNPAAAAAMNAAQAKPSTPTVATPKSASPAPTTSSTGGGGSKRSAAAAKRAAAKEKLEEEIRKKAKTKAPSRPPSPSPEPPPQPTDEDDDVPMPDANPIPPPSGTDTPPKQHQKPPSYPRESAILPAYTKPPPRAHPGDADPLLASYVPPFPTDAELRELMTAPPLSYPEARAAWSGDAGGDQARYPTRLFCVVCGYWGRVKCMKCGGRVCALECLEAHREECSGRYGM